MRCVALDFETFYSRKDKYSLTHMTTREYIMDPRFEAILLTVEDIRTRKKWQAVGFHQIKRLLGQFDWTDTAAVAHNMYFDGAILAWIFDVHPVLLLCTMSLTMPAVEVPKGASLAAVAKFFGLPDKGTMVANADGLRLHDMSPDFLQGYVGYGVHDTWLCVEIFLRYLQLVPARELYVLDATIRMYTDPCLLVDEKHIHAHIQYVERTQQELVVAAQEVLLRLGLAANGEKSTKAILNSAPKFAEALKRLGVDVPMKLNKNGAYIPALAKTDAGLEALLDDADPVICGLIEARLNAKSTLERTRSQRFLTLQRLGPIPFPLYYFGAAQTGRWSAWDSINMQNLPRKSPLKAGLAAPAGWVILDADLSQIELRIGLRLAGEFDLLALLAQGKDLYRISAGDSFNKRPEDVTDEERQMGKVTELSAIFGVGAANLQQQFRTKGKLNVSMETSQYMIDTYRSSHKHVKAAWGEGNNVIQMILRGIDGPVWGGLCHVKNGVLIKPSGLPIRFPNLHENLDENGQRVYLYEKRVGKRAVTTKLYGARVFQNAVQSIARDFFAEALVRVSKVRNNAPYLKPVGLIHDAILAIAPEKYGIMAAKLLNAALTTPNPNVPDVPLACEVKLGATYGTATKLAAAELELFCNKNV